MKRSLALGLAVLFATAFVVVRARAEDNEPQPGVARVSVIHGDVSLQRGDSGDWVAATINAPAVAGDNLSSGVRSRMEVQLDYANVLRLGGSTEVKLADLTRTHQQVQLRRGLINFSVFKGSEADVEIDTVNVAIRPVGEGSFRVLVPSDDETQVVVRKGEADVTTPQGSTTVKKGDMIVIRGRDNPEYKVSDAPRTDDFDDWTKERDNQIQDARSYERTNRYYTGVSDLDRHGHWIYVPDYGWVWSPYGEPGWAPYRYGRWVWEPYWGWTWASYEPWGWAPYHYGRWFYYRSSWCWWPGPVHRYYRPIWAPAYVSFFGWGHGLHVSIGFGFGSIGWVPIGPSDYFYPWWGAHRRAINVVNVTNITNITNVRPIAPLAGNRPRFSNVHSMVSNPRVREGVTSMSADDFGRRAVPRERQPVREAELRDAKMVAGAVPVVPTRDSLRTVDRDANPATVRERGDRQDRFFTRSQPQYKPEPFQREADQVQQTIDRHRPVTNTAEDRRNSPAGAGAEERNTPARVGNAPNRPATEATNGGDGRRVRLADDARATRPGENRVPDESRQTADPQKRAAAPASEWRRFGDRVSRPQRGRETEAAGESQASGRGRTQTPTAEGRQTPGADQRGTPRETQRPAAEKPSPARDSKPSRPAEDKPARERGQVPPSQAQRPAGGSQSDSRGDWNRFSGSSERPRQERSTQMQERPSSIRDDAPARRNSVQPGRIQTSPADGSPSDNARPSWQRFEPRPERSASPRSESSRRVDSTPSSNWPRGTERTRDMGSSGPGETRGSYGRQSAPRAERPTLDMGRPIVIPRAERQSAPAARQGSSSPRRESPSPRGGGSSGKRTGGPGRG